MNKPYVFCPYCGSHLTEILEEGTLNKHCIVCQWTHYQHSHISTAAIIIDYQKNKVLLVQRAQDPHKGLWSLPAGFSNLGEHPGDTIKREVKEETGLTVIDLSFLEMNIALDDHRCPAQLIHYFHATVAGKISFNPNENLAVRWFSYDNLPKLAWNTQVVVLRKFIGKLTGV